MKPIRKILTFLFIAGYIISCAVTAETPVSSQQFTVGSQASQRSQVGEVGQVSHENLAQFASVAK